ncbi:MAG: hypothetical protein IJ236_04735 [Oscillospiraceae bacterium]|nr:hypothetical protein [Oscillospiraceae bacterium]
MVQNRNTKIPEWKKTSAAFEQFQKDAMLDRIAAQFVTSRDFGSLTELTQAMLSRAREQHIGYRILRQAPELAGTVAQNALRDLASQEGHLPFTALLMHRLMEQHALRWRETGETDLLDQVFYHCQRTAGAAALAGGLAEQIRSAHAACFPLRLPQGGRMQEEKLEYDAIPHDTADTSRSEDALIRGLREMETQEYSAEQAIEEELALRDEQLRQQQHSEIIRETAGAYPWETVRSALMQEYKRCAGAFPEAAEALQTKLDAECARIGNAFYRNWFVNALMRRTMQAEDADTVELCMHMAGDLQGAFDPARPERFDLFFDSVRTFKPYSGEFLNAYFNRRPGLSSVNNARDEKMDRDIERLQESIGTADYPDARLNLINTLEQHIRESRSVYYDKYRERFLDEKEDGTSRFRSSITDCVDAFADTYRRTVLRQDAPGRLKSPLLGSYGSYNRGNERFHFKAFFSIEYDERNAEDSCRIRNAGRKPGERAAAIHKSTFKDFTEIRKGDVSLEAMRENGEELRDTESLSPAEAYEANADKALRYMTWIRVLDLLRELIAVYRTGTTRKPEAVPGSREKVLGMEKDYFHRFFTVDLADLANEDPTLCMYLTGTAYHSYRNVIDEGLIGFYSNSGNQEAMTLAESVKAGCRPTGSFQYSKRVEGEDGDAPCGYPIKWLVLREYMSEKVLGKYVNDELFSSKKSHYQSFLVQFFDTLEKSANFLADGMSQPEWNAAASQVLMHARLHNENGFLSAFYEVLREEGHFADEDTYRTTLHAIRELRGQMLYKYERFRQKGKTAKGKASK